MCDVLQHFASRIIWINEYDLCLVLHMLYCAMRCCAMSFNATRLYAMLYLHVLSCTVHMMLDKLPYYRSIQSVIHLVVQPFQSSNASIYRSNCFISGFYLGSLSRCAGRCYEPEEF